ncbi:DNA repair protein RecO [Aureitalea marina]|uniref:DNA repair protein RecO n=1 Tax=Aureitalea marina TaxID=930804 RepID=A0A2S7KRQ0_9FLAO|nr:DNA repair protein RecO [Aureitalea marina]PQB05301.1 DNA repair protein RecO [Aureitalea marina]
MVVQTQALVLSTLKYGEADLIAHLLTREHGIRHYLLRGIRKSRKGKLRVSYFQPLTQLEIQAFHKDKGTLERIKEARLAYTYQSVQTDVVKSTLLLFLAEVLQQVVKEEVPDPDLFEYVTAALVWLDQHEEIASFHILFLLRLTAFLGFYPDLSHTNSLYFDLMEGRFHDRPEGDYVRSGPEIEGLKAYFGIDFDRLKDVSQPKNQRLEVLDLLLTYYQLHLQQFKKPRSLPVLIELFN